MEVVTATLKFAPFIAKTLSVHFHKINTKFGYNRYKTDEIKILSHVSKRLEENSSKFHYYMLLDNSRPIGFINTLSTDKIYEIIALCLLDGFNTQKNAEMLLKRAVLDLREMGAERILAEVTGFEKNYQLALKSANASLIEQKYKITF